MGADDSEAIAAWNALVLDPDPSEFPHGDPRRQAALASIYMGLANNGGLNHFLESTPELDAGEVLSTLNALGANVAAVEFARVLDGLGEPLPASTEQVREEQLERLWTEELDDLDILSEVADEDIVAALERHVTAHLEHYLGRTQRCVPNRLDADAETPRKQESCNR